MWTVELYVLLTAMTGLATAIITGMIVVYGAIKKVHKTVNSRMDELLELTRQTAYASGVIKGREKEQDEAADA